MNTSSSRQPVSITGRLGVSVFFLFFAGFGLLFIGLMVREALHKRSTHSWPPTPCRILSNQVLNNNADDLPYALQVRYRYEWKGTTFFSTQVNLSGGRYKDLARADRLGQTMPVGSESTCYVNPNNPAQSVLQHESSPVLWFLPLPLLFVAIGVGGMLGAWRPNSNPKKPSSSQPISNQTNSQTGQRFAIAFVLVFILMSSVFLYLLTLKPIYQVIQARDWTVTPCVIESSQIRRSTGSKSTTYSVDIAYRYTFQDKEHRGNQYSFISVSTSGYSSKQRLLSQYPPGLTTICYVNPQQPSEAVLNRDFNAVYWFGLIPVLFIIVGSGLLVHLVKKGKATITSPASSTPSRALHSLQHSTPSLPIELKPRSTRMASVLGLLFFGLIWNGVVSVFVYQIYRSFQRGSGEWFLTLFMIPFVLIGLGVMVALIHQLMAFFNPRTHLTLDPGHLSPGQKTRLRWSLEGRTHRIHRLQIVLEGRESATYQRGTDRTTAHSLFHQSILVDLTQRPEIQNGEVPLEIPLQAPPSFHLPNNQVEWSLRIVGKITRWPDIDDAYVCTVNPVEPQPGLSPNPSNSNPVEHEPDSIAESLPAGSTLKLGFKEGQTHFPAGGILEGAVGWSTPQAPTQAEVRLFYFTRGRGTSDVVVVETLSLSQLQSQDAHPFSFLLPTTPPSIEGTLVSIIWAIEVVLQPGSVHARREFTLTPNGSGQPISLQAVQDSLQPSSPRGFHVPFRKT